MQLEPVFFLSTGRCGTLALQRYFQQSPQIEAFHRYRGRWAKYRNDMAIMLEQNYAYYKILKNPSKKKQLEVAMIKRLRRSRIGLINKIRQENRAFFELNHEFASFGPLLGKAFPEAKFIHIFRDPRSVVNSFMTKFNPIQMSLPGYFGTRFSLRGQIVLRYAHIQKIRYSLPKFLRHIFAKYEMDMHLHPFRQENENWVELDWSVPEKLMWYWSAMNSVIEELACDLPRDKFHTVRFEDLFSENSDELGQIIHFCTISGDGLPEPEIFYNRRINIKEIHRDFPSPDQWSPDLKDKLSTHCSTLMEQYGYK